jgi:urease accessory protein
MPALKIVKKLPVATGHWHGHYYHPPAFDVSLSLTYAERCQPNLRTQLDNKTEIELALPANTVLHDGDLLQSPDNRIIRVEASPEHVSTAFTKDHIILAQACYELGKQGANIQIGDTWLRYLHDPSLDKQMEVIGLQVFIEYNLFDPK